MKRVFKLALCLMLLAGLAALGGAGGALAEGAGYTVEFARDGLEYVLPGDSEIPLSEILSTLGLSGEVTAVEISDESLFSASDESGIWIVTALQPFSTTEWMKVTINGVEYEITVTDDNTGVITLTTAVKIDSGNKSSYEGRTVTGTVPASSYAGVIADAHFDGAVVVDGVDLNLTIDGFNVDYSEETATLSGISLFNGATLHLTVKGTNTLKAGFGGAGISVPAGCTLDITAASTGTLNVVGGRNYGGGAGIGSIGDGNNTQYYQLYNRSLGSIVINGGTINAQGGTWYIYNDAACGAAGIGGSAAGDGTGSITINGGTVTATGGRAAAGIGGGYTGTIQSITINGGTVTANSNTGSAAIGTGYNGNNYGVGDLTGPTIVINGGTVTANGNIGFGEALDASQNVGGSVTISGNADVTASNYSKKTIYANIYDERLTTGATLSNARLSLSNGLQSYGDITVARDGVGTASFRFYPEDTQFGTMTVCIESGTYTWEKNSANIPDSGDASIALQGQITGSITTYLDENGDAQTTSVFATPITPASDTIGTGWYAVTENVTVSERINVSGDVHLILCDNTTLTAEKGISVTGDNSLTIYAQSTGENMGALTATGPVYYAGIGGYLSFPDYYAYGDITINGGRITATTADSDNAGIGGAGAEESKTIVINGGNITATGGYGIGGGSWGGYAQTGGTIKLGWNNENTRIQVNGVYRGYCGTVTYQNPFVLQGTTVEPTSDNLNTHDTKYLNATLVPAATVTIGSIVGDGSIDAGGTLHGIGSTVTLTPVPAMGYKLDTLTVTKTGDSSTTITVSGENTFTMPAYDVTVSATFILNTDDFTPSSDGKVYTIQNAEGWDLFCYFSLQDDYSGFSGKTIKLAADISVSTMAGDYFHHFTGDFDGQGHTLTINYEPTEGDTAPFQYAEGCTIQNLHVNGVITTSKARAAGIISSSHGNVTIRNCRSSVIIHSSYYDSSSYYAKLSHGGLVSSVRSNGHLTIDGCVFDGKILTGATKATEYCGGYVSTNNGTLTIINSLYAPAALSSGETEATGNSNTFAGSGSITNCYYTRTLGTAQGKLACKIIAGENVTLSNAGTATVYNTSGITSYGTGIEYGGVYYAGSEDSVSLNLSYSDQIGHTFTGYTASAGTLTGTGNPYTLTMPVQDVTVTATFAEVYNVSIGTFTGGSVTGAGTYQIGSTVTLTAVPDSGYMLTSIEATKTGDSSTSVTLSGTGNTRTFTAPAYDVTVTATFTIISDDTKISIVSIGAFTGGSVTGEGTYLTDSTVMLTAVPDPNYQLASIEATKTGDPSTSVTLSGTGNTRTFTAPAYDVTVTATFTLIGSDVTIHNTAEWNSFCDAVNGGNDFSGKTVVLGADIGTSDDPVTRMAGGTESNQRFKGTFDGNGHTLTVEYTGSEKYSAPFRQVQGATIKNLKVEGNIIGGTITGGIIGTSYTATNKQNTISNCVSRVRITTSNNTAGGIAGSANSLTIENCTSSAVIEGSSTGLGRYGGFIGSMDNSVVITGCIFNGGIKGETTHTCGGFIGSNYNKTVTITNCLFAPSEITVGPDNCATFACHGDNATTNIANSYYTQSLGETQGKQARKIIAGKDVTLSNAGTATVYNTSGITSYGTGIKYGGVYYAGSEDSVRLNMNHSDRDGYTFTGYTASAGALTGAGNPYTLTMPDEDVTVTATYAPDPAHFEKTGENEYTIHTATGWDLFCDCLNDNDTWNRFSGKTVKLDASITVTRMAGSSGHDFCGTFNGDGNTITIDSSKGAYAVFSHVSTTKADPNDAEDTASAIKNLRVTGTINTSVKYAAGLISQMWGNVTIENCRSSVIINSSVSGDGTHGGFVAASNGYVTITGCVFDGKLLTTGTEDTTCCGGFVGWGGATVTNSLYAPAAIGSGETEVQAGTPYPSATFVRNGSAGDNCYYTRALGTAQGKQPLTVAAGDEYVTVSAVSPIGNATATYSVSGITAYASGITRGGTFYYGNGDDVSLTLSHSDAPEGYAFTGYAASAGTLDGTTLTMPDENVTVSAIYAANTYTVSFDKNAADATGTMEAQGFTYDEAAKALTANTYTRTGCDFAGWNTVAAPTEQTPGTAYADGQSVQNLTAEVNGNVTLYAQWTWKNYNITVAGTSNGAVNTTVGETEYATTARYNDTVILAITPDEGYALDSLTVTDADDNPVAVDENGRFTMPAGDVTVTATFALALPPFGAPDFTLPTALTAIEESAFEGLTGMTVVDASSVTDIGKWAFKDCTGLTQIRLSQNCSVDPNAFDGCETVYVFAPAGGTTETSCAGIDNCVFVAETHE